MLKYNFILFIGLLLVHALHSQDIDVRQYNGLPADKKTYILQDDFTSNSNEWPEYSDDDDFSELSNGFYNVQTKTSLATSYLKEFSLSDESDFEIEIKFKMSQGITKAGNMLVWGADKTDNAYNFSVNTLGEYSVSKYVGDYSFLIPWTKTKLLNADLTNKLTVRRVGSSLYFFINENLINQLPYSVFFGNEIGFQVAGNSKLEVDYLYISQIAKKKTTQSSVAENKVVKPTIQAVQPKPQVSTAQLKLGSTSTQINLAVPVITVELPELKDNVAYTTSDFVVVKFNVVAAAGVKEVLVDNEQMDLNSENSYVKIKELKSDMQQVSINVIDQQGKSASKQITLSRSVAPINPNYHALFIGQQKYMDQSISSLDEPIADCEHLIKVLTTKYTFKPENIIFLKNATRDEISIAFDKLLSELTDADNLMIFYAGHGVWDEQLRKGFWLPSDSKRNNRGTWFSNSELRDYISGIKAKHVLLIADACFGGGIFKTRDAFSKMDLAINELNKFPSRKAMTSGAMNTVPDKSVFVEYLVKRLDQNTDKYLPAEQLFSSFKTAVINNSPVNQIPQYGEIKESGDEGGDFIFIKK